MSAVPFEGKHVIGLSFRTLTIFFAALFFLSIPACWAAATLYGVDRRTASNAFYLVFILVYSGILALPWLNLAGQQGMTRVQRLERMCIAWLGLEVAAACFWSGPWLVMPKTIVAAKGQMWAYGWWAYMDGGDARYTVTDAGLLAMEKMGIVVAVVCAVILLRRFTTGKFTDNQLWTLMFFQAAEFGVICVYFISGLYLDLSALGGPSEIIIKYIGSNVFWLLMPPVVFWWSGQRFIERQLSERLASRS